MERWLFYAQAIHDFRAKKKSRKERFPHAITVFVDNLRLMVATRMIIKYSGSRNEDGLSAPGHWMCRIVEKDFLHFLPCPSSEGCGRLCAVGGYSNSLGATER